MGLRFRASHFIHLPLLLLAVGLGYELANYLSKNSNGAYQFNVEVLPRNRLDMLLTKTDMIIPWVSYAWFGPKATEKYQWSKPIFKDASIYIWNKKSVQTFSQPEHLKGFHLGGIQGYHFINVGPLVKSGEVKRSDTGSEQQLLEMLLLKRFDDGIGPYSSFAYIIKDNSWKDDFSYSIYHNYQRHFLIKTTNKELSSYIEEIPQKMLADKNWGQIMQTYGLDNILLNNLGGFTTKNE
ncbi:transporter substrate-binding domain-containing protein [Neptunomonas japonica]|uniref:transporter substrate-binding domain-containing protein n=1 Tax=Neptunomonas japonica TaxID=417574 RepID=UPI0004022A8E|nr:transporter substrate-binding domain-containing protein [Neptunomonas japonica]